MEYDAINEALEKALMEVMQYEYELKRRQDEAHLDVIDEISAVLRRAKSATSHDIWARRQGSLGSQESSVGDAVSESAFEEATTEDGI
jgi:hypothetical protein